MKELAQEELAALATIVEELVKLATTRKELREKERAEENELQSDQRGKPQTLNPNPKIKKPKPQNQTLKLFTPYPKP
jgi:hypothetical protein